MKNFTYCNPTKIEFGKDKENKIGDYIAEFKVKKILITYGSDRIKKDGLFKKVVKSLKSQNIEYIELSGIQSNPLLSKVYEGIKVAKEEKVEGILAIGGGSVLDTSKAIAAGSLYQDDVWDFFSFKATITEALPIFDIMTLAATGSEMNGSAVITNEEIQQKYFINAAAIYPKVSVINPDLQKSVSNEYLVYSAVDIIAHSIEGYFTATYHPNITASYVETNIKTVISTTEKLLKNKEDYEARSEFAWAATQALNGTSTVGAEGVEFPNHMIEHAVSALYNVPHGAGLSVVMPAWMKWYYKNNKTQFERFAKEIFGLNSALEGIEALEKWFNKIGSPTKFSQFSIDESSLSAIAKNAHSNSNFFGLDEKYTEDKILEILKLAL
ncbi:iron-containing alcohol dehydrogenase [Arcobacter sp. CECT 8985]|uniref:iron-containing alcohol dehydrogenase n=1 Tax=Arcobacter sp. CECT 8985 TaxID=1935424 RepID=UPI00100BCB1F|nr:iron-containing alcohol dehydrogenase [Arcobacter sp. CECT 8985]RXJ87322.1 NADH-dependent alcohol dehydrogenase [Arcobacter sp. CECT 8985]